MHGGLLYKRGNAKHEAEARECGFDPIDLVAVNLYPFETTVAKHDVTLAEAIENIDIGGPAMIRSAAKNYESVTVIIDPADYEAVLENMGKHDGETTLKLRERLAIKAFNRTAEYDRVIANFLNKQQKTDASFSLSLPLAMDLRYGENPHQKAAMYGDFFRFYDQLSGKELSFNNILDVTAAAELIAEFGEPTVAILKHNNPCGVGLAEKIADAWEKALATDRQAPFGGIIVVQPAARPSRWRKYFRNLQRGDRRAAFSGRGAPAEEKEFTPAQAEASDGARDLGDGVSLLRRRAGSGAIPGWCRRRTGKWSRNARRRAGGDRSLVRVAGRQAREIQRHRLREQRPHDRHWRRPDVAR